ncbi:methyltransferase TRM13-domain-containing protein [Cokeromyces recurvatus]|uniref:methyltransferase TRM13-domain-containing protein n=1 Tax=Cokeromyces recurvatus TaxID=90255 RepID=UPI0022209946|nr:methyltransferase TRM13-domain-containing protein [Cokeromyces recurvatus]KAI7906863.1 methyltransferase TRM13-domain-containing protein [Cokeromyces recurvatus]
MPKDTVAKKSKKSNGKSEPFVIPPVPTKPQQCHFFVLRKRRYCGLPAKKNLKYCGEHLTACADDENAKDLPKRIPCPYDNSHTIFEKDLENHLKNRCNARPRELPKCHSLNVNCTLPLSQEELDFQKSIFSHQKLHVQPWLARVRLNQLSKEELESLIDKVSFAYDAHVPLIPMEKLTHSSAEKKRQFISNTKHLDQLSSLLGHLEKNEMLKDKTACFTEFGAGKGDLSAFVKRAINEENGEATYLLIDRKSVRNKADQALLGHSENKSRVQRQMIDIKDLVLSKVDCIADNDKKVVAMSKHLCGCATDITLKCLMNYVEHEKSKGQQSEPITGIIIALCCHQICRYEMYPNQDYLKSIGVSKTDFERLCKMTSWATCKNGRRKPSNEEDNMDEDNNHAVSDDEDNFDETANHFSGRDAQEREAIGYKCKRILDAGRVKYLEQFGFDVKLVYYVDLATSLENCALIATPKRK